MENLGQSQNCSQPLWPGSFKLGCHWIAVPAAGKVLSYHLAFEDADRTCKETLRDYPKCLHLQETVRLYVDICPSKKWCLLYYTCGKPKHFTCDCCHKDVRLF